MSNVILRERSGYKYYIVDTKSNLNTPSIFSMQLRRDFERSNNSNTFMFVNNRDFGKLFKVKQKRV